MLINIITGVTNNVARCSIVQLRNATLATVQRSAEIHSATLAPHKRRLSALLDMDSEREVMTRQARALHYRAIVIALARAIQDGYRPSHTPKHTLSYRESRGLI